MCATVTHKNILPQKFKAVHGVGLWDFKGNEREVKNNPHMSNSKFNPDDQP